MWDCSFCATQLIVPGRGVRCRSTSVSVSVVIAVVVGLHITSMCTAAASLDSVEMWSKSVPSAACCRVTDNQYTTRTAPIAWRACETFASHRSAGTIVLEASDVFMLGCTFIEVLTGCSREPYDWLTGEQLIAFRAHDTTRDLSPLLVRDSALRCLPGFGP